MVLLSYSVLLSLYNKNKAEHSIQHVFFLLKTFHTMFSKQTVQEEIVVHENYFNCSN